MGDPPPAVNRPGPGLQAGLIGVVAAIIVAITIQAVGPAMNDPDSAASVLYFRQIVAGHRLETFVSTTPKPLLTLVYGLVWTFTGDWRALGWVTIAVFGIAVASGMALTRRWAGGGGAVFLVVAMTLSPVLALEVSRANSFIWALAAWLVAGLALSLPRPRVWLAAVALLLAFLSRTETVVLVLPATLALMGLALRGRTAQARRLAPLLLAWMALPIASLHDLILTGDPFYWLGVPAGYTAIVAPDLRALPPFEVIGAIVARYAAMPILVGLSVVGAVRLAVRRQWLAIVAIGCLTTGVPALLVVIAWRHIYVTTRYLEQVDIGLLVAGAVGAGWLAAVARRVVVSRWRSSDGPSRPRSVSPAVAIGSAVAILAAVAASIPPAQLDRDFATELDRVRTANRNADVARPQLAAILATTPESVPAPIRGPADLYIVDTRQATILVPRSLLNRLLVDLDAPLTRLGDSWLAIRRSGAVDAMTPGQVIYHDRAGDQRPALFGVLEVDRPMVGASTRLAPLFVDPVSGIWILEASAP